MSTLNSFGVRNLRSFGSEKQMVPIKPLNILVGKNSCGKSTFLRSFPLLRQSVESNTKAPILWFGQYVDFGSLKVATNDDADEVIFDFSLDLDLIVEHNEWDYMYDFGSNIKEISYGSAPQGSKISLSIGIKDLGGDNQLSKVRLQHEEAYGEFEYTGTVGKSSITIGCKLTGEQDRYSFERAAKGALIPRNLGVIKKLAAKKNHPERYIVSDAIREEAIKKFTDYLMRFQHHRTNRKNILDMVRSMQQVGSERGVAEIKRLSAGNKTFQKNIEIYGSEIGIACNRFMFSRYFNLFLAEADSVLRNFFSGVRYLGPMRAAAERYYRHQDLQVEELDHTGSNISMVINSLDHEARKSLQNWIHENFSFWLDLSSSGLHYELNIKESGDSKYHNISDMGFGYSQILPIIVSVWLETNSGRQKRKNILGQLRRKGRVIVIEQPELHLHPALQYKFGLALAKVASIAESHVKIVVETHSKPLIDALGESVMNDKLSADAVSIVLFEKKENLTTSITLSGFDTEGYLINWPAGFMAP